MAATSARMLSLLSLLQARRDWPGTLLAERLGISPRTVRRDVDRLRELGYNVHATKGPDGGYRLDSGSELPPLLFDDDQAPALAIALQTAPVSGAGLTEAAARALATVRQTMPDRLRRRIDSLQFSVLQAAEASVPAVDPAALAALGDAIRTAVSIRFDYATPGSATALESPPRRAEPHDLVVHRDRWYLVAWDLDRDDWRIFRADRISLRSHTGARFSPRELPGHDAATFVAARFKGSEGVDEWPCAGEVTLAIAARELAPYLGEGMLTELDASHCRVRVGSWSWQGVAARVAGLGAGILAAEPAELRTAMAEVSRRLATGAVAAQ